MCVGAAVGGRSVRGEQRKHTRACERDKLRWCGGVDDVAMATATDNCNGGQRQRRRLSLSESQSQSQTQSVCVCVYVAAVEKLHVSIVACCSRLLLLLLPA